MPSEVTGVPREVSGVGAPGSAACSAQARLEEEVGFDFARRLMRVLLPLQRRRGASSPYVRTRRKMQKAEPTASVSETTLVQPIASPPTKI